MPEIHHFHSLDSTMIKAAELAAAGCESRTIVVADEQTAGQGRYGHSWHSQRGDGLYMSQVRREKICPDSLPVVTLALGLATVDTLRPISNPDLKWPNDVLLNGRKCAGILVQLCAGALILGIGINLNQTAFPPELEAIATSLRIETARCYSRDEMVASLASNIDFRMSQLLQSGKQPILDEFTAISSFVRGRQVLVETNGSTIQGITDGLDPQGFLRLRKSDGTRTTVVTGGVRACS